MNDGDALRGRAPRGEVDEEVTIDERRTRGNQPILQRFEPKSPAPGGAAAVPSKVRSLVLPSSREERDHGAFSGGGTDRSAWGGYPCDRTGRFTDEFPRGTSDDVLRGDAAKAAGPGKHKALHRPQLVPAHVRG